MVVTKLYIIRCVYPSYTLISHVDIRCNFELKGLLIEPDGILEFVLKHQFRYKKDHCDQGNNDQQEYKWVTVREDRLRRGRWLVTHFLALAFADRVVADLEKSLQLRLLKSPEPGKHLCIHLKDSALNAPVFRHCNRGGAIS